MLALSSQAVFSSKLVLLAHNFFLHLGVHCTYILFFSFNDQSTVVWLPGKIDVCVGGKCGGLDING